VAGQAAPGYRCGAMIRTTTTDWEAAARPGARVGDRVEVHRSIGSTNDRARELLVAGAGEGVAIVAEEQTAGRGRMGRTWTSPPGVNLTASVGLRPALAADAAWALGPAAALAARSACAESAPVALKWPNDLVDAGGRKVGGLLIEVASESDRLRHAVLGFGINVNWARAAMPEEVRATATSLCELTGADLDRPALLRRLLEALEDELEALEAGRSPLPRYREACSTLGAVVTVEMPTGEIEGRAVALDERGALLVETEAGPVAIASGDVVRVRPAVIA
jgi:BirA family biotin operon repressor/biotin-[acetyl-CoA-carboxylase] ligase